jgi:hypothetical protein
MPFDKVQVVMRLKSLNLCGFSLYFEYFLLKDGQKQQKLAFGEQEVLWSKGFRDNLETKELPMKLIATFKKYINGINNENQIKKAS